MDKSPVEIYSEISNSPKYMKGDKSTYLRFDYVPNITKSDIDKKILIRYFAKQTNLENGEIVEISEARYNTLRQIPLYTVVYLEWRIAGPLDDVFSPADPTIRLYTGVITANKLSLENANKKMPGIQSKLLNLTQYYKE